MDNPANHPVPRSPFEFFILHRVGLAILGRPPLSAFPTANRSPLIPDAKVTGDGHQGISLSGASRSAYSRRSQEPAADPQTAES